MAYFGVEPNLSPSYIHFEKCIYEGGRPTVGPVSLIL